jgi:hypothetical protein
MELPSKVKPYNDLGSSKTFTGFPFPPSQEGRQRITIFSKNMTIFFKNMTAFFKNATAFKKNAVAFE